MGKDYKIGIVIGLAVLVLGVGSLLMRSDDDGEEVSAEDAKPEIGIEEKPQSPGPVVLGGPENSTPVIDPADTTDPAADSGTRSMDEGDLDELVVRDLDDPMPTPLAGTGSPTTPPAVIISEGPIVRAGDERLPVAPPEGDVIESDLVITTITPPALVTVTGDTYTVKEGDDGFWYISEKVYGDGKHYALIQKANPTVNSLALRAGMKLTIPPLPTKVRTSRSVVDKTQWGKISTDPITGKKYYIIKANERGGFWSISDTAYGDGKYFALIQKANPQIQAHAMKAGTKVYIPPLPIRSTSGRTGSATIAAAGNHGKIVTDPITGKKYYIVKAGDYGFSSASKAAYGTDRYFERIQKANPTINSRNVKAGAKILIPPRPLSAPRTSTGAATRSKQYGKIITENGKRYYVVADGDAGFWGISVKVFKNGKYMADFTRANPNVDSGRLRPGDKILIPTITRTAPRRRTTPGSPPPPPQHAATMNPILTKSHGG